MTGMLDGIRVVEVSMWGFVPTTGVVLADWGADVIKVEHPVSGDPARGVVTSSWIAGKNGVKFLFEIFNRGKRCAAIDLANPDGLEVFYKLLAGADVLLTSLRPDARDRLGIGADEIRRRFPSIVYAGGSGLGLDGPDRLQGGFDLSSYWSRAGVAYSATRGDAPLPVDMPSPGFGDIPSGTILAGGVAAALVRRGRTGEGTTIDLSLLNSGMWAMSAEITATEAIDAERFYKGDGRVAGNPLVCVYRTADNRFVQLVMTDGDRHWADLCNRLDRPELVHDERFGDQAGRTANAPACIALLEEAFAERTEAEWRKRLDGASGVWSIVQSPREVASDPQAIANGYIRTRHDREGRSYLSVASPVREVGAEAAEARPAPAHGEHSDDLLLELGLSWDELVELKLKGAIL